MAIFTGAGVALVTPFTDKLEVDYNKLEQLIDYQIEQGTDALIICGTTGEASTLTHEEHLECIKVAVSRANKRIPVIAGTGSNCTETAKYLSKEAEKYGVDGLLLVTPYYNKATQKGLVGHFTEVANHVDVPIILYNVPSRTGCNIAAKTAATLVNTVENIVGIKEASGNMSQAAEIMLLTDGKIDMYSGNDDQILPILSLGGKGVISVLSNIAPRDTHDIVAKYLAGDHKGSLELQLKYLPLIKELFCEVNPIPVKKAVELVKLCNGYMRKPLTEMEEENTQRLLIEMKKQGIV